MKNTVYTRPLVYGHSQNVDNVLKLMSNPNSMQTSYQTYKPLLDAVDYKNAAYALVIKEPGKFSDTSYTSWTSVNGKVELVKAFNLMDNKSIPAALDKYTPQTKGKVLVIKVTGDLTTIQKESDNIDTIART
jgi:triacylglycerol esterase/lipase EstA (alpha/beta hydrolase family)